MLSTGMSDTRIRIHRTIVRRGQAPSGAGLASASAFAVPSYEEARRPRALV